MDWLQELSERGWCALPRAEFSRTEHRLSAVFASLGAASVRRRGNRAMDALAARPNTLSRHFGLDAFPLHTDGADLEEPPRYVVLNCTLARSACTLVLDHRASGDAHRDKSDALFRVAARRSFHYARFQEQHRRGPMIRYNPVTHSPVNASARTVEEELSALVPHAARINWKDTRLAIIDNWTCLHGRNRVGEGDRGRMHKFHVWVHQ